MTMQIQVSVSQFPTNNEDCVGLEITPHGVGRELFRLRRHDVNVSFPQTIWTDSAVLVCTGRTDGTDGTHPDDELQTDNPLEKFLQRSHPEVSLTLELRNRISELESTVNKLRSERDTAVQKLSAVRRELNS